MKKPPSIGRQKLFGIALIPMERQYLKYTKTASAENSSAASVFYNRKPKFWRAGYKIPGLEG